MNNFSHKQRGISMIEILITIVITAIGFLGIAGMQLLNLKTVNNTQYRSMATLYAYDMAERMRSNITAVKAGLYEMDDSVASSSTASCTACTSSQMAAVDGDQWKTLIDNQDSVTPGDLPSGTGKVEQEAGTSFYNITVSWDEQQRQTEQSDADGNSTRTAGINVTRQEFVLRVRM